MVEKRSQASGTGGGDGLVEIGAAELHSMIERGGAVVIDVREPDEYAREHIDGAVLLPLSRFDPEALPKDDGKVVVLHCRSGVRSAQAAGRVLGSGAGAVHHLRGGITAWRRAGFPVVEDRRAPISVIRQVHIIAGAIVVLGSVLAAGVSPWFWLLTGFVGAGQLLAGITGNCALGAVLAKMPWNGVRAPGGCDGRQASSA